MLPNQKQISLDSLLSDINKMNDLAKQNAIQRLLTQELSPAITCDDVIRMIQTVNFQDDPSSKRYQIIQDFLKSPKAPAITSDDVIRMINTEDRLKVVPVQDNSLKKISFFRSTNNKAIQEDRLKESTIQNDLNKVKIIKEFLKSPKSSEATSNQIIEMIKQTGIKSNDEKVNIILDFLKSPKSYETTSSQIIEMIKNLEISDESAKVNIIKQFLKSPKSSETTSNQIIEMINQTDISYDWFKEEVIQEFLKSSKSSTKTIDNFIEIIKQIGIGDLYKGRLINQFLRSQKLPESTETISSQIVQMIKDLKIEYDVAKGDIIQGFLRLPNSNPEKETTSSQIIEMIKDLDIKDDNTKGGIIKDFINHSTSSADFTPQDVARIAKQAGLQYRPDLSIEIFDHKFSEPKANYIKNFIDFIRELHPSEAMQCEFVWKFIQQKKINLGNVNGLKPFIEGLQDNDLALDLIANLSYIGMLENEIDTLSLVKNRSSKQYAFLTKIVGGKALNDCITEDGIEILKTTFGDNLKVGDQPITVSDLISYYDIKGQTTSLSAMLKPEFKKQLRDNFVPSAEILLYKPEELEKLNSLMSEEGTTILDVKSYFVENAKLCDYLKEKVGEVKEINSRETYQINFANFGIAEEKQAEINTLFNKLLKSSDPNKEEVVRFFEDLLGITLSEFNEEKKDKLTFFFQQNKKELAHCFCNENLPKANFQPLFTTLQDGCMENIGAQFKKMLYGAMIKDEHAQILYAVADDKIFSGIINNHGSDIMVDNFNPINNEIIKAYSLSPMALVEKLSKEAMLTPAKTWEIIQKNLGDNHDLIERLTEKYTDIKESNIEEFKIGDFNKKAKEIASYLIVKNVVGEEKMNDLESKNPQLKELGDFIYGEVREASIADRTPASPQPSPRPGDQDTKASCFSCFGR